MRRIILFLTVVGSLAGSQLATRVASAVRYDAVAEFSNVQGGTTEVWRYQYQQNGVHDLGWAHSFNPACWCGSGDWQVQDCMGWYDAAGCIPALVRPNIGTALACAPGHLGGLGGYSVVLSWTAPQSATGVVVDMSYRLVLGPSCSPTGDGCGVRLLHNGQQVYSEYIAGTDFSQKEHVSSVDTVQAGDIIQFFVDAGSNDYCDEVGFNMAVEYAQPPQQGACCAPEGTCTVTLDAACVPPSMWHPDWKICIPNPCPPANDGVWTQFEPAAHGGGAAIYDPVRDRMIVFGGLGWSFSNETWALSFNGTPTWSQLQPSGPLPPSRGFHSAIYDSTGDRMIVFGGLGPSWLNDTWALSLSDPPVWSQLEPSGAPPLGRCSHTAIYDPVRNRMIVFGGANASHLNDTWELTFASTPTWHQLSPSGSLPLTRYAHSAIYDPLRDGMIVFGGYGPSGPSSGWFNDTWIMSLTGGSAWSQLSPSGVAPAPRYSHIAIYDSPRDRMVVFAGNGPGGYFGDVATLSLADTPVWSQLSPSGGLPPLRSLPAAIYDPARDRMVVSKGYHEGSYLDDTWALSWSDTGACCHPDGTCMVTTQAACASPSLWHLEWLTCSPLNNCLPPTASCCGADGSCAVMLEAACLSPSTWHPELTTCTPNECPVAQSTLCRESA